MNLKEKALQFATKAHSGQTRKGNGSPYIIHPTAVGKTLEEAGFSDEVVAAGYLHDVVEDTNTTIREIEENFGPKVAYLVRSHTEDKTKSWEQRKLHTIDVVKNSDLEVKALIASDKLNNLDSLIEDYLTLGEDIWLVFKRGYEKQKWYHTSIANNLMFGLENQEAPEFFQTFIDRTHQFFTE